MPLWQWTRTVPPDAMADEMEAMKEASGDDESSEYAAAVNNIKFNGTYLLKIGVKCESWQDEVRPKAVIKVAEKVDYAKESKYLLKAIDDLLK